MTDQNLPTYQQLVDALCDIMDGVQVHDIVAMTGLSDDDAAYIDNVRRAVTHLWDTDAPRNFG